MSKHPNSLQVNLIQIHTRIYRMKWRVDFKREALGSPDAMRYVENINLCFLAVNQIICFMYGGGYSSFGAGTRC